MFDKAIGMFVFALALFAVTAALALPVAGYQPFKVWVAGYTVKQQRLIGEAELARAEQTRRIYIEQAQAERDAAEIQAEAIAIVGEAAKQYPEYRYQEFLGAFGEAFREGNISQVVYIPTESMIPVTEATANRIKGGEL